LECVVSLTFFGAFETARFDSFSFCELRISAVRTATGDGFFTCVAVTLPISFVCALRLFGAIPPPLQPGREEAGRFSVHFGIFCFSWTSAIFSSTAPG
tara:strand:+ start:18424 stop:18717 length:294 start_codon:yes stop_codon:yes gene_type:complete